MRNNVIALVCEISKLLSASSIYAGIEAVVSFGDAQSSRGSGLFWRSAEFWYLLEGFVLLR